MCCRSHSNWQRYKTMSAGTIFFRSSAFCASSSLAWWRSSCMRLMFELTFKSACSRRADIWSDECSVWCVHDYRTMTFTHKFHHKKHCSSKFVQTIIILPLFAREGQPPTYAGLDLKRAQYRGCRHDPNAQHGECSRPYFRETRNWSLFVPERDANITATLYDE